MNLFVKHRKRAILKPDQLSEFCRHVGAMCSVGVPLAAAMEILQAGTDQKNIRQIYQELQQHMEQGCSFSAALEKVHAFPVFFLNMFRAAEAGGHVEETAKRLAIYYRKEHRIRNQIHTATLYPKIVGIIAAFVLLMIFIVVIPTVEPLFAKMELPGITKALLGISRVITEWWLPGSFMCIFLYLLGRIVVKRKRIQMIVDRLRLHLPLIGRQYQMIVTARFARSESNLYSSGLPLMEGLTIAAMTAGNRYLEEQLLNVVQMIQGGSTFSQAIETVDGLDRKLAPVIFVGEETGKLDELLEDLAESYENEAELAIHRLVAMIEPVMLLILGMVIGLILLGIMMPIWSMYDYMI